MIEETNRHLRTVIFAALALLAYRVWLTYSTPIHLFFDEAYYYGWSQSIDWGYYSKPPMVAWLIRITTDLLGDSEWAIKVGAPILYSATAIIIFNIGNRLRNSQTGFSAALLFLTMPLVSFNSLFITTDAPLLFFWALALLLFLKAQESNSWRCWILAGVVGGLGLLSKYTFILFPAGFLLYALISKDGRTLLTNIRFWFACILAISILMPNLWWNYQHDFISFQHTAEIAQQAENSYSLARLLEFLSTQFVVFGPIAMVLLMIAMFSANKGTKLLWSLFVPIFVVISIQALSARANINWGAPAYVTGVLIAAFAASQMRLGKALVTLALLVNLILMVGFYHYPYIQNKLEIVPTQNNNPYTRISGWFELAKAIEPELERYPDLYIASESRKVLAYFGYYREPKNLNGRALDIDGHIISQYELKYPIEANSKESYLFVSEHFTSDHLAKYFVNAEPLKTVSVRVTEDLTRTIHLTLVSKLRAKQ